MLSGIFLCFFEADASKSQRADGDRSTAFQHNALGKIQ